MACIMDAKQALALENEAIAKQNLTVEQLMNKAGRALAGEVEAVLSKRLLALANGDSPSMFTKTGRDCPREDKNNDLVIIICGKGNNAGDGFVAARYLHQQQVKVKVLTLYSEPNLKGEASKAYEKLPKEITSDFDKGKAEIAEAAVLVDAIFGFSFNPPLGGIEAEAAGLINSARATVISADVPSGLEASSGLAEKEAVKADITVCFSCIKKGLLLKEGPRFAGNIKVADIGIKSEISRGFSQAESIEKEYIRRILPKRDALAHKKSVGTVLVIAGSKAYTGAAVLTAEAALRAGCGLATLAVPEGISQLIKQKTTPEVIVRALPQTAEGTFSQEAVEQAIAIAGEHNCLAIGPGLTTNKETANFVNDFLVRLERPAVIDADALNAIAKSQAGGRTRLISDKGVLGEIKTDVVLTPHAGELSRLTGLTVDEIEDDRFAAAKKLVSDNITVLLKGRYSVIASKEQLQVNLTSNPGMASAGTGDVLTGVIASFVAQGLTTNQAAALGVYLHGLAADIAAEELTQYSLMATDIIDCIPYSMKQILSTKSEKRNKH